ncbi:serine/threonine protein kinase [Candidatus Micrarchaeota archaeon]|nr:serine/threonine protein kinase [Candidatus Micrarchaeota archaeon]
MRWLRNRGNRPPSNNPPKEPVKDNDPTNVFKRTEGPPTIRDLSSAAGAPRSDVTHPVHTGDLLIAEENVTGSAGAPRSDPPPVHPLSPDGSGTAELNVDDLVPIDSPDAPASRAVPPSPPPAPSEAAPRARPPAPSSDVDDPLIGTVLTGRMVGDRIVFYKITEPLGSGGQAAVYLAECIDRSGDTISSPSGNGSRVALKILSDVPNDNDDAIARFVREAEVLMTLNHPNIIKALDFGQIGRTFFIAFETLSGSSLEKTSPPVAWGDFLKPIVLQICNALEAAHTNNPSITHRDIKPSNIFYSRDGQVKLLDFGIARIVDDRSIVTRPHIRIGSYDYMAPEQFRDEKGDSRSDLFSLGVLMYHMLTGTYPFTPLKGNTLDAVVFSKLHSDPVSISDRCPSRKPPEAVEAIIMKLLKRDPNERYQSAREVADAIIAIDAPAKITPPPAALPATAGIPAPAPISLSGSAPTDAPPLAPPKRKSNVAPFVFGAVIAALATVAFFKYGSPMLDRIPPDPPKTVSSVTKKPQKSVVDEFTINFKLTFPANSTSKFSDLRVVPANPKVAVKINPDGFSLIYPKNIGKKVSFKLFLNDQLVSSYDATPFGSVASIDLGEIRQEIRTPKKSPRTRAIAANPHDLGETEGSAAAESPQDPAVSDGGALY